MSYFNSPIAYIFIAVIFDCRQLAFFSENFFIYQASRRCAKFLRCGLGFYFSSRRPVTMRAGGPEEKKSGHH